MRADAQKNYEHLLDVARAVIAEQGADASLRDVARQAGVVVGTLYRHFPTRDDLLVALLHTSFDHLTAQAVQLQASRSPQDALVDWLRECVTVSSTYRGVTTRMVSAIEDPTSALHASCVTMRAAGTRLLTRAQAAGVASTHLDGEDLFALIAALAWLGDQPPTAKRAEHLFDVVLGTILRPEAARLLTPSA